MTQNTYESITRDIAMLSYGTLATLIDVTYCDALDHFSEKFLQFNEEHNQDFKYRTWVEVFNAFKQDDSFAQVVAHCKEMQQKQEQAMKDQQAICVEEKQEKAILCDQEDKLLSNFLYHNHDAPNRQQFELKWLQYSKEHELPISFSEYILNKHFSVPVTNDIRLSSKKPNIYDVIGVARSDDTSRKQLNGFCITDDGEIAATDGRRLHFAPYKGALKPGIWQRVEKRAALNLLQGHTLESVKALRENGEFALNGVWNYNHPFVQAGIHDLPELTIDSDDWFYSVEGTYPNYRHVVPDGKGYHTIETPKRLVEKLICLKKIIKLGKVKMLHVALRMHDDGYASLNFDFFHDAVMAAAAHGDCVSITMKDAYSPCVIKGGDAVAVLMPLRDVNGGVILNDMDIAGDEKGGSYVKVPKIAGAESKAITTTTSAKKTRKQSLAKKMADALRKKQKENQGGDAKTSDKVARSPEPEVQPESGKETILEATKKVLKNLAFEQLMRWQGRSFVESRLQFIHRLFDEGKLEVNTYTSKKGKEHFITGKQFAGETAYNYAKHLLDGGEKFDFTPVTEEVTDE